MNYLAHLYLSFDDSEISIGNYIADFVKGNKYQEYETGIKNGILIHREIDYYTDQHPIFIQGKRRLAEYRHYSGVIMDIYYDHFLSKNWSNYSPTPLKTFTTKTYLNLKKHKTILPENAQYLLKHMEATDWLYNYQFIQGIQFALSGMSRRTSFDSGMERSVENLQQDYTLFEEEFHSFFKDIVPHIHNFTDQLVSK